MRTATSIFIVLLIVGAAHGQDKPAAEMPSAPKPPAELKRLESLEGTWHCEGVAPAGATGPGSPETRYTSSFRVSRAWDGFAYTIAYDQKDAKPHFAGAWNVGWDGGQKKL